MSITEIPDISVYSVDTNKWITSREDQGDILGIVGDISTVVVE